MAQPTFDEVLAAVEARYKSKGIVDRPAAERITDAIHVAMPLYRQAVEVEKATPAIMVTILGGESRDLKDDIREHNAEGIVLLERALAELKALAAPKEPKA